MAAVSITRPLAAHRARWEELYAGYAAFYAVEQTPAMREHVWGWIHDPAHEVKAFLALDADGRPVGLAHFRPFARPLAAAVGGFLDDLFVDPAARGSGAADALIAAVADEGRARLERDSLVHGGGQLPRPRRLRPTGGAHEMAHL
ncbi:GNAT family N-acetyltransferase [Chelatococcus sp. SYSU_G07232]|uniref:GNAT family N-acetyltransferase n=1 Tax=Chelatococcus albus TaxID=3047466 RepID=A0ABT7AJ26_9HYPH|nr:GNAT family N-acetyltransferase [Chelatococcus sp. SYSU_G07232]MDJ1159368.1 GNAT family N-acetyltransferase [Chelatococcus sp. SYSU_G07232]